MLFKPLSDSIYDLWQAGMPAHNIASVLGIDTRKVEQEINDVLYSWSRDNYNDDWLENG